MDFRLMFDGFDMVFVGFPIVLIGFTFPERPQRQGSIRPRPPPPGEGVAIALWAPGETQQARITYPFSPGETQKARFYPLTPATAGRGSCDCPLGPRRDPKGKNHISVLSRRDPKGKVLPGEVVAIALWAPEKTQKARITYPFSPGETQKARFCRGNELRLPSGPPERPKRQGSSAHSRHQTLVVWWFSLFLYGFRCFGCCW
jgi:hypothetical protein